MAFTETGHNSGDVFILEFATALFSVPNNYRTSWEDIKDMKTFLTPDFYWKRNYCWKQKEDVKWKSNQWIWRKDENFDIYDFLVKLIWNLRCFHIIVPFLSWSLVYIPCQFWKNDSRSQFFVGAQSVSAAVYFYDLHYFYESCKPNSASSILQP